MKWGAWIAKIQRVYISSQSLKYILSWVCSNDLRPLSSSSFNLSIVFCFDLICLFYFRMERSRGNEHRMESTDGKSYAVQLRKLCSHILGKLLFFEKIYVFVKKIHLFLMFFRPCCKRRSFIYSISSSSTSSLIIYFRPRKLSGQWICYYRKD